MQIYYVEKTTTPEPLELARLIQFHSSLLGLGDVFVVLLRHVSQCPNCKLGAIGRSELTEDSMQVFLDRSLG